MSTTRRAACPICDRGPKDTAMVVTTDERGTVSYCHRCHYTATENHEKRPDTRVAPAVHARDWSDTAERIWRMTLPLGELAVSYLTRRACLLPPTEGDLRFLAPSEQYPPTLCARITDALTGRPLSLHFTPLLPGGVGHGERRFLAGHRKRGGVIRLWPDSAVTSGLAIAEGIETALAAARIYRPVWSCIDAGNLQGLPVLAAIDCLAIYADHDEAGIRAAQACARRWEAADREVCIYRSRTPGEDLADMLARIDRRKDPA